jgi:crotonobetainyl-CoA:carnitine CoA-transferase CaiB-like acyl-CoA transferase
MTAPLAGVRVLDLTHFLSGPFCTMILGDLGAEVLKIEDPAHLDDARTVPPFSIGGHSTYYLSLNRNKKSVTLDLKTARGRELFYALVSRADAVVDNFRPGVTARLEIDYPRLRAINPAIVCCSLSGFGATGPARDRPGYDYLMQALSGLMSLTGEPDQPPAKAGISIVDHVGGLFAAVGVLAVLVEARRTGIGRQIDLALLDCQLALFSYLAANFLNHSAVPERQVRSAHPFVVPCQNFRAADGWLSVTAMTQRFWERLCAAIERPDLREDPRFRTREDRYRHRKDLVAVLDGILAARPVAEWMECLLRHGVPAAPVNDLPAALGDPQVLARGMVRELGHTAYGRVRVLGNPVKVSGADEPATPPPCAGEHTEEILCGLLGLSATDVAELRESRVC